MASNMNLEDTILKAVDIVASKKIESAGFDKTIQATIVSCVDATIGKYRVKYQDSYWYAYSGNIDTTYPKDTNVFILVPGGDMNRDKTILGTTKKLGINYVTVAEGEEMYSPVGANIISNSNTFNLCSYKTETIQLYNKNGGGNQVSVNIKSAQEYLKKSNHIIAGATFKTNLPVQQRYQGDYGISFGLDFIDNATKKEVTRYYTVDVDKMSENPYKLSYDTRQYGVFEIDGINFVRINSIILFVKNFPMVDSNKPNDIFISNIELTGATNLSQEDLDSCALVLTTPEGYIFDSSDSTGNIKTIHAEVRVKGKKADEGSQSLPFYWFIENVAITPNTLGYNKYGGQGWECLNKYNVVKPATSTSAAAVEYIPMKSIYGVNKSDILSSSLRYKCAVIYDGTVLTKQITIFNEDSVYDIEIESDNGTQFYYDIGNPTLTCKCQYNGSDVPVDTLNFMWGVSNNANNFQLLPVTEQYNNDYNDLALILTTIEQLLESEDLLYKQLFNFTKIASATGISSSRITELFNKYQTDIDNNTTYDLLLYGDRGYTNTLIKVINNYKTVQRIENNKIFGLNIKNITNFATFKCSVFNKSNNQFLGTGFIKIDNLLQGEDLYSLVINDGSQVFKYNAYGVAPTSKQNKIPYEIPTLTFTVYDNLGNPIADQVIQHSNISWIVPNENTMLEIPSNYKGELDNTGTKMIYKDILSLDYKIAEQFDINKNNNNIELKIDYNGLNLVAKTDLTFTKDGNTGINGTDYVCKIVPNVIYGEVPTNPVIYYNNGSIDFNWHTDSNRWFKVELWHNGGNPIFSGTQSGQSTEGKSVNIIKWEVLKNKYSQDIEDKTNISIGETSGACSLDTSQLNNGWDWENYTTWRPANIIKVTVSYDEHTYYATMPVTIAYIFNSNYRVSLKERTGFQQVVFNSGGINPNYDNHAPFEMFVEQYLGATDRWQDISNKITSPYKVNFDWYYLGSTWRRFKVEQEQEDDGEIHQEDDDLLDPNQPIADDEEPKEPVYDWQENVETNNSKKWLMTDDTDESLRDCQKAIKPVDKYNGECVTTAVGCRVYRAQNNATIAWIHIPIHMMRDISNNSSISGWSGNNIKLRDIEGGNALAPQTGAGVTDAEGRFTGIIIGTVKDPLEDTSEELNNTDNESQGKFAATDEEIGLFGYHEGARSIFLDAKTGKSVFGQTKQAQIILDPTQVNAQGKKVAQIKSGGYIYKPGTTKNTSIGKVTRVSTGKGMMIDLSTPEIKFGSGDFEVDKNGKIKARGGGQIAGWAITDWAMYNSIVVTDETGKVIVPINSTGMNSNPIISTDSSSIPDLEHPNDYNGSEYRPVKIPPNPATEDSEDEDKNSWQTVGKALAFWAGKDNFYVTHDGYLQFQSATVGSGKYPIYISGVANGDSAIFSGKKATKNTNKKGFYIGVDGLGIGKTKSLQVLKPNAPTDDSLYEDNDPDKKIKQEWLENEDKAVSSFQIDPNGMFYATKGYIGNGKAGWEIGNKFLRNGKLNLNDTSEGIYIGTNGIGLGKLQLKKDGSLTGPQWSINKDGTANFQDFTGRGTFTGTVSGDDSSEITQQTLISGTTGGSGTGGKQTIKQWVQAKVSGGELTGTQIAEKLKTINFSLNGSLTFGGTVDFTSTVNFTGTVKSAGSTATTSTILQRVWTETSNGTTVTKKQGGFKFSKGLYTGQADNAKFVWKPIDDIKENNKTVYFLGYYMP